MKKPQSIMAWACLAWLLTSACLTHAQAQSGANSKSNGISIPTYQCHRIDSPEPKQLEFYAWSPTGANDFHRPWRFGVLKFK